MARVLVVEDDDVVREVVVAHLRRAAHRVLAVGDAQGALDETAGRTPPDIAVVDIGLPGMDGFELVGKLRARSGYADLPVIFLSGRVEEEHIEAGRRVGYAYLTKPFIASALLHAIDRALADREPTW